MGINKGTRSTGDALRRLTPAPDEELKIEVVQPPVELPDRTAMTVHLIHPSSAVLLRLFDLLTEAGFQVSASSNADDALAVIARSAPRCVIATMDMPEMKGTELVLRARLGSPSTRVILLSDYPDGNAAMMAKASGASDIVEKGIAPEALLRVVRQANGME